MAFDLCALLAHKIHTFTIKQVTTVGLKFLYNRSLYRTNLKPIHVETLRRRKMQVVQKLCVIESVLPVDDN